LPIAINMKLDLQEKIEIPQGIAISLVKDILSVKGPKVEIKRCIIMRGFTINLEGSAIIFSAKGASKREKRMMKTSISHVKNMIKGIQSPYVYQLKVCYSHFPMNVSVSNNQLVVKNFLGEKVPRILPLSKEVTVKIEGQVITVSHADKELAGRTASDIEQLTRISNKDRRVFQDGIHITHKAGVGVSE